MNRTIVIPEVDIRRKSAARIAELSGQNIAGCIQCGKCTAGCMFAYEMDLDPHQVVRLSQLGMVDELVNSEAIWYCATCFTCGNRCPVKIDIAAVSEALRLIAYRTCPEKFGPDHVSDYDAQNAPQQALVSLYRKLGI